MIAFGTLATGCINQVFIDLHPTQYSYSVLFSAFLFQAVSESGLPRQATNNSTITEDLLRFGLLEFGMLRCFYL